MKISISKLSIAMIKAGIGTAKKLSEVSGVSVNTISRFRNGGTVKLPTLQRIAAALDVDPSELIEEVTR